MSEIFLRLTQSLALFFRPFAVGHVDRCTDIFHDIAGYATNGMPGRANVFHCSVWKNEAEFHVKVRAFLRPFKKNLAAYPITILRMNALVKRFV